MTRETASEKEMIDLGAEIGERAGPGEIYALAGQLGAGKTHFTKGIVRGLGGDPDAVTSPTFTLVHEYPTDTAPVFHFDFYRIDEPDEVLRIGWDEYIGEGVIVVEWADKFPDLFPEEARWWRFEILDGGGRLATESAPVT